MMKNWICNKELEDSLRDLHHGLHAAMDALIKDKDHDEAEVILRQMDQAFMQLLNEIKMAG